MDVGAGECRVDVVVVCFKGCNNGGSSRLNHGCAGCGTVLGARLCWRRWLPRRQMIWTTMRNAKTAQASLRWRMRAMTGLQGVAASGRRQWPAVVRWSWWDCGWHDEGGVRCRAGRGWAASERASEWTNACIRACHSASISIPRRLWRCAILSKMLSLARKEMLEQPKVAFARASKVRHCDAKSERGGFRVVQTWGCIGEQQAEGAERGP